MACKVNASAIAKPFSLESKTLIRSVLSGGIKPFLVGFLASDDPGSLKYAEWTKKSCERDGIKFEVRRCELYDLERKLLEANEDKEIHGIMIYYPCFGSVPSFFGGSMDDHLRDSIAVEKDVEGLCLTYRRCLYRNIRTLPYLDGSLSDKKCLLPCTALAIVKVLEHLNVYDATLPIGNRMANQVVTIINRSEVVGRPLSAMLANDGAKVYSADISSLYRMERGKMLPAEDSVDVESACKRSGVIVTGVPSASYRLPSHFISPGTVIVNVSHYQNVDFEEIKGIPDVKYVPLIGKVTVSMLQRNLIRLVRNFHMPDSEYTVIEAGGRLVRN